VDRPNHIRRDLKSRRDVYIKFVTRLDAMLSEALQRRQRGGVVAPDPIAARIAAFRLTRWRRCRRRSTCARQPWMRIGGPTSEQGQGLGTAQARAALRLGADDQRSTGSARTSRAPPIDGLKLLAAACEMARYWCSRELKEAVAGGNLPEGEVSLVARGLCRGKDEVAIEG